jgi:signal transduction histidine kinase
VKSGTTKNGITLEINDNGTGFDPNKINKLCKGTGLQSLVKRIKLLGAAINITSEENIETFVVVKLLLGK